MSYATVPIAIRTSSGSPGLSPAIYATAWVTGMGHCPVVYEVQEREKRVVVVLIAHRSEAYG